MGVMKEQLAMPQTHVRLERRKEKIGCISVGRKCHGCHRAGYGEPSQMLSASKHHRPLKKFWGGQEFESHLPLVFTGHDLLAGAPGCSVPKNSVLTGNFVRDIIPCILNTIKVEETRSRGGHRDWAFIEKKLSITQKDSLDCYNSLYFKLNTAKKHVGLVTKHEIR